MSHNVDEAFHAMAKEVKDRVARQNPDPSTGTRSWGRWGQMIQMILQLLSMFHVGGDSFGQSLEVLQYPATQTDLAADTQKL